MISHALARQIQKRHFLIINGRFGTAGRAADLMHIFDMKVDNVTERTSLCSGPWLWRSAAIDIALHIERPTE
jgi:hypothetical protein